MLDDDAAVWKVKSRLDSWQVMFQSVLEACAALQTSSMDRYWNIFCAISEGKHGKRAWDSAAEHILVMIVYGYIQSN